MLLKVRITGLRIMAVVLALSAARSYAGLTDINTAVAATPTNLNAHAIVDSDHENLPETLNFEVTTAKPPVTSEKATAPGNEIHITEPVAAPLPVALLPGGMMLAGSFLATRVFKRRIV